MSAQLQAEHGLTISDYEVLLLLSWAPNRQLRRVDLADGVLLTASGITRLLDGLERAGYVERCQCDADRRVVYAVLTNTGLEKLRTASQSHFAQIDAFLEERLEESELEALGDLLAKLGDGDPRDCAPDG